MTQNEPAALENAEAIIERFGGIRPMATKINVPVTTIQGWKKRNVIPGTRRAEILEAAQTLGVDLSDVLSIARSAPKGASVPASPVTGSKPGSIANENEREAPTFARAVQDARGFPPSDFVVQPRAVSPSSSSSAESLPEFSAIKMEMKKTERRAITKSTFINIFLLVLVLGSAVLLLWPQQEQRIAALEGDVAEIQEKQSFFASLIPDNIEQRITALQEQMETGWSTAIEKAQALSTDIIGPDAGSLEQRVERLEGHVNEMAGLPPSAGLADLMARLQEMTRDVTGEEQLSSLTSQLMTLLSGVPDGDVASVEQALQSAPAQNPELAEAFSGVPPQDMKAAAMLVGLAQFRTSLNRSNQPFENDLAVLKKLVGNDDLELAAAIDRLAPYAQQGVLTPEGLNNEFRGLAGDVVMASLQGEDVSIKEKAQARLGEMFKVEKDGEPIGGTPTQNTLAKTNKLLESGDLAGALSQIKTLDGPAAMTAQPWVDKAQATLMAQQFKSMLSQALVRKSHGSAVLPTARGLNLPSNSELIQDDETGINILRPDPYTRPHNPFKSQ